MSIKMHLSVKISRKNRIALVLALLALACVATEAQAYIDPQTTQTVLSGFGAILAAIGTIMAVGVAMLRHYIGRALKLLRRFGGRGPRWTWVGAATALVCAIGFGFWIFKEKTPMYAHSSNGKRLIVIGFDGMDPKLTRTMMAAGKLPHFKQLAADGAFKPLATINPPQSPVVWTSMATGVKPAGHGITDFITRKNNGYVPELSLVHQNDANLLGRPQAAFSPPVAPKLFFWEQLVKASVAARVISWPLTFPAAGDATVLSGLGTPDIMGGMGRYTIYTTAPEDLAPDIKGNIVVLPKGLTHYATTISGPLRSSFGKSSPTKIDFVLTKQPDGRWQASLGQETFPLEKGVLSPWIRMTFPLGLGAKAPGMAHFLLLEADGNFKLYMSPIEIDPLDPLYTVSTQNHSQALANDLGRFHTLGLEEDTNALGDGILNEDQFLMTCDATMRESEQMMWAELGATHKGYFGFVYGTTDRIQHMFWRFRDPGHPLYDATLAKRYGHVIEDYYERADRIIGDVMNRLDPTHDTLLVVSDHGFTNYRRSVHINSWLIAHGYMHLKGDAEIVAGLFRNVDWSRTKAFALGFSQIFLNIKGRDAQGTVDPAAVPALKQALMHDLTALVDPKNGDKVIEQVYDATQAFGGTLPEGPDLIVGMNSGYRFSWQTAVGGAPDHIFDDNAKRWSGDHCVDPHEVPGVILSSRPITVSDPSVLDIAPTALALFGVDIPTTMHGRDLLREDVSQAPQPRRTDL